MTYKEIILEAWQRVDTKYLQHSEIFKVPVITELPTLTASTINDRLDLDLSTAVEVVVFNYFYHPSGTPMITGRYKNLEIVIDRTYLCEQDAIDEADAV